MNGKNVTVGACLLVGDIDTMARYYRDILGFNTDWSGGNFAEFETGSGKTTLFMYSREEFVKAIGEEYEPPKGINQTFEVALWLPSYADVDAEFERLSKMDVKFPCGAPITFDFGVRNFYVADPEGNLLEIGSMNKE
ncbi:MAG: VOC family protein [Lachnospiraceae bacterium]|nr:VOC family protein [Lachnospiraceae bacterium]MDD3794477.1 VOC family protein [Lachnospiraceae bacterium]